MAAESRNAALVGDREIRGTRVFDAPRGSCGRCGPSRSTSGNGGALTASPRRPTRWK